MLTEDELDDLYLPSRPDSHHAPAYIKAFARLVEAKIEAKLREQEPTLYVNARDYKYHVENNRQTTLGVWRGSDGAKCNTPKAVPMFFFEHPAPIPEGYALVPIEPTDEMLDAGSNALYAALGSRSKACYAAMLAAARSE